MNIVYNCDENYAPHLAAGIVSVFENNPAQESIRVFVLGNGIGEQTAKRLKDIGDVYLAAGKIDLARQGSVIPPGYCRSVTVTDTGDINEKLKEYIGASPEYGRFAPTALIRIFAPEFLPDDLERYIYIDCDTVVLKPLSMLFAADLKDKALGMAAEPTIYPEIKKKLGMADGSPYHNSGMMLVDRKKWERLGLTEKCMRFYKEKGGKLSFPDQDIINGALSEYTLTLWQGYNFFSNYYYRSYKSLVRLSPWYAGVSEEESYESARKAPAVVHFAGDERPWYNGSHNPYRKEYEKYLELSPWAGTEKIRGHEGEMLRYHAMNLVTLFFPGLRDLISHRYYETSVRED